MEAPRLSRHERWRLAHQADRYMRHLSSEALERRLHDIMVNMLYISEDCKLGLLSPENGGAFWLPKLTEVLEEFRLRFGNYPAGFRDGLMQGVPIPLPTHPLAPRAVAAVRARPLHQPYLIKYGSRSHMQAAHQRGELFVRSARSLNDSSLDPARRDDELEVAVEAPGDGAEIKVFDGKTGQFKGHAKLRGNIRHGTRSQTDFFVYCMATAWDPRLFLDFRAADAALVVTKPRLFLDRMMQQLIGVQPAWTLAACPVRYYDPLRTKVPDIELGTNKNFRYAYQREFRVLSVPTAPLACLDSFALEIGSLTDCSELVVL